MDMVSDAYKIFFVFYHEEETVTLWEVKIDNMYCNENIVSQKVTKLLIRVEYKLCRIGQSPCLAYHYFLPFSK